MSTESKVRLAYVIGLLVLCAVIAVTALAQEARSPSASPAPIAPSAYARAATDPSPTAVPNAPEEPGVRTIETLSQVCVAGKEGEMWCGAYLMGVADTMMAFGKGGHKGGICGVDYNIERLRQVFTAWVRQHPEFLELDMLAGANLAFREVWPCG